MNSRIVTISSFYTLSFFILFLIPNYHMMAQRPQPTLSQSFYVGESGSLSVLTDNGRIYVEGTDSDSVYVEVLVKRKKKILESTDPFMDELDNIFNFSMQQQGNKIHLQAKRKGGLREFQKVRMIFLVKIPQSMQGDHYFSASGGRITLNRISGNTEAETSGGRVEVYEHMGNLDLASRGGRIVVKGSQGDIYAKTSGGGITLTDNRAKVEVYSSGGGIDIEGSAEAIFAETSGGGIRANLTDLSEYFLLETSGGGISATVPEDLGLDLDLSGSKVKIDLSNDFTGIVKRKRVNGSINGGGIPFRLATSGGSLSVNFQ